MENNTANITEEKISHYLESVKIKHSLMGLDEKEVWILISNVQKFYRQQLEIEKEKSDAVISVMEKEIDELKEIVDRFRSTDADVSDNDKKTFTFNDDLDSSQFPLSPFRQIRRENEPVEVQPAKEVVKDKGGKKK